MRGSKRTLVCVVMLTLHCGCLGENSDPCITTDLVVGASEETTLGYSVESVVESVDGPHDATFTYSNNVLGNSGMTIEVTQLLGDIIYHDLEPNGNVEAQECRDYLSFGASIVFETTDGRFQEEFSGVLSSDPDFAETMLHFMMDQDDNVALAEIAGNYEPDPSAVANCEEVEYTWSANFYSDHTTGGIKQLCMTESETDDEDIIGVAGEEVGNWQ